MSLDGEEPPDGRQVVSRARDMGGARGEWGAGPRSSLTFYGGGTSPPCINLTVR